MLESHICTCYMSVMFKALRVSRHSEHNTMFQADDTGMAMTMQESFDGELYLPRS